MVNLLLWYVAGGREWGSWLGFPSDYAQAELPIGVSRFWSPAFLWFYLWFFVATAIFAIFGDLKQIIPAALVGMGLGIYSV